MSVARETFCERIRALRRAILDFKLQDRAVAPENLFYNQSTRILRNGLVVQCFNVFEDFIKARTAEILLEIGQAGVSFDFLPEELRRACTVEAIKALDFQLKLQDKADRIRHAQDYCEVISSTKSTVFRLAEITFFHSSSNISKEQFKTALLAFSIDNPWKQISGLSSRIGVSGLPAENLFSGLAQRRHTAAHVPSASTSEIDLNQSIIDATTLGSCYDLLISQSANKLKKLAAAVPNNIKLLPDHKAIPLRFIKHIDGSFRERREDSRRSVKVAKLVTSLLDGALRRATSELGALIVFDESGLLVQWSI